VEVFLEEGAPMDRVAIGHSADSTDVEFLEELLRAGVYLSMDRYPGAPGRPNWEQRNTTVKALIDRGWANRLMLGHDYAPAAVIRGEQPPEASGPTRYLFVSKVAIPALMAQGVDEATIDMMMREVPRRFLAGS
jgi:phosphotriesterase-related protein